MDAISDMLNRIRNAQNAFLPSVDVPFSNINYEIAKILEKENLVEKAKKKKDKNTKRLGQFVEIALKYRDKAPAMSDLKRISKPGQRFYAPWKKIKKVKGGYGITIISTPKGLMTGKEARKQKLGGEIW